MASLPDSGMMWRTIALTRAVQPCATLRAGGAAASRGRRPYDSCETGAAVGASGAHHLVMRAVRKVLASSPQEIAMSSRHRPPSPARGRRVRAARPRPGSAAPMLGRASRAEAPRHLAVVAQGRDGRCVLPPDAARSPRRNIGAKAMQAGAFTLDPVRGSSGWLADEWADVAGWPRSAERLPSKDT